MYKDYFGFKEEPFSIAPDPQFLFMSERHREALAHLIYGMKADSGFVLLTGEVGTGKTTVCRCLLGQIPERSEIAFILNPKLSVIELLATICDELKIVYPAAPVSVKLYVDLINRFLLDAHARGQQTILIIDEAQNLSSEVLEQIRLLTNLETDKHKLLQVIMLGQPELNRILERPEMRQLAQRVTARYHLEPLEREELEGYLSHRLAVAGVERPLFPPAAINKLYRLSGGVPRLINLLCDRALLGSYVKGENLVSTQTLKQAAEEVFGREGKPQSGGAGLVHWLYVVLLGLLLVVAVIFVAALWRLPPAQQDPVAEAREPVAKLDIPPAPGAAAQPLRWAAAEAVENSSLLAYQALFELWGIADIDLSRGARQQAEESGLELLTKRANLGRLQQLNRPAVVKIVDPEGENFYALLRELKDGSAGLVVAGDVYRMPISQLLRQWYGDFALLWQPPPNYERIIKPGDRSPLLPWLEQQMAQLTGRQARVDMPPELTGLLLDEIKAFQKAAGIDPDGIVGPYTLILLNTQVGSGRPTLRD